MWPDGVFAIPPGIPATFHPAEPPTDEDVARLARALRQRVLRFLRKRGKLPTDDADQACDDLDQDPPLLATLAAAAVQGRTALGPKAGSYAERLGRGSATGGEFGGGKLCADCEGLPNHGHPPAFRWGMHGSATCVPDYHRERLEKLCRYAARPPVVHERLSLTRSGKVLYKLKRRFRDGSTHVVLDPMTLIERLAALVPRPRVHLTTYHGVFAPAASHRDRVVPPPPNDDQDHDTCPQAKSRQNQRTRRKRYAWADLMKRVFEVDVLICEHCGGTRNLLTFLTEPRVVRSILEHLGLPADSPPVAPARPPPLPVLPSA